LQLRDLLIALALLLIGTSAALAHPHQWVDAAAEVLFDAQGRIAAIRHHWRFDEAFTAFATQGLDADGDLRLSAEELEPLARENVESLADFDFFTFLSAGDYQAGFGAPTDYSLDLDESRLTLHFTLPLAQPLFSAAPILLQVYDPSYYIAMVLPSREAVRLVDAPAGCRLKVTPAAGPDAAAAEVLATIGPDQRELPAEMQDLTGGIDNSAEIHCGGPTVATAGNQASPQSASAAAELMAQGGGAGQAGDLGTLASVEADGPSAGVGAGGSRAEPEASGGILARLGTLQAQFNRDLTQALSGLKADGSAFWWLAALLNMTSMAMTDTAKVLEAGSFALVAGLGVYLLATKGPRAWVTLRGREAPGHNHHAHPMPRRTGPIRWDDDPGPPSHTHKHERDGGLACACGHHHVDPAALERPGLAGAAAAVVSVGLRPCTGALVVLVFALAQGIFWAGVASTFLMALGTAITVAALAALAVGAKDIARRLAAGDDRRAGQAMLALEILAALFLTALGAMLFLGALSA
jgi:nickel/cobalt exporter